MTLLLLPLLALLSSTFVAVQNAPAPTPTPTTTDKNVTFSVDYEHDTFLKDGEPFRYVSCNMHYFQIPRELWRDRMTRVRALGCNVLQTYIMWSMHQPLDQTSYVFDGDADIGAYLSMAQELGFLVVIRPGPFINAEMDFGGLPYWLLKKKDVVLRTSRDQWYLQKVQAWLDYILPTLVKPRLYANGGPIILVQVENEYGGDTECDGAYMVWLRDLFVKHLGPDTVLITTDPGWSELVRCGHVEGAIPTIDFGCLNKKDVEQRFSDLRQFLPKGPMVNSEYYPGWLDVWGNPSQNRTPLEANLATMRYMWDMNVTSFNIYPAHGGTNWGYRAGGKYNDPGNKGYRGVATGYDFDAPVSESGDLSHKFVPMRELIEELTGRKNPYPIPDSPPKYAYGRFRMDWLGTVFDLLPALTPPNRVQRATYPMTMEELDQPYGFVIYETAIPHPQSEMLNGGNGPRQIVITGVRDRAYVMIDGQVTKVIQRVVDEDAETTTIQLPSNSTDQIVLQILVENQGRVGYGMRLKDPKGLLENVTIVDNGGAPRVLTNWTMYPIDLSLIPTIPADKIEQMTRDRASSSPRDKAGKYVPSVYAGNFSTSTLGDTFFDPTGWGKGQLFINERNIGRYWPLAGPQITLYVPSVYLVDESGINNAYVFELEQPGNCEGGGGNDAGICHASLIDKPIWN